MSDSNIPSKIPLLPPKISYEPLMKELTAAHAAVGELRGLLKAIPEQDILIAPFRKREAVASSAIEGTRATLEEVLEYEAVGSEQSQDESSKEIQDFKEIMNYEAAMNEALKVLQEKPIGENLLKRVHATLLRSVRGATKDPGNFRKEQVRVGDYIPPVHTDIPELIKNWEEYLNSSNVECDPLIRIGVAHYQFEAIHPFKDGNGRIGRLIIPLFLCQENLLQTPVLYVSHHLEKYKVQYQDLLHKVDTDQEWIQWLRFFLVAVESQAKTTASIAREIQDLYEDLKDKLVRNIKSQHVIPVLDLIFSRPVVSTIQVRSIVDAKSRATSYNILQRFVEEGVLEKFTMSGKESIYAFPQLLKIVRR
jgi:Fic family protein